MIIISFTLKKILIETYVGNSCVSIFLFLFVQEDGLVYYNFTFQWRGQNERGQPSFKKSSFQPG